MTGFWASRARASLDPSDDRFWFRLAKRRRTALAWTPPSPFNPFPSMLYARADAHRVTPVGIEAAHMGSVRRAAEEAAARLVFHHHWTGWVLGAETDREAARRRLDRGLSVLESLGHAPLIWTVHNAMPHECWFEDLEAAFRQQLADRADRVHVMNPLTAAVVAPRYRLDPAKVVMLEHPSYEDVYPAPPPQPEARRLLEIDGDGLVVGAIGQVRAYKRLDLLLDALELAADVRLIVAGATGADDDARRDAARAEAHQRVLRIDRHLDDAELSMVLGALDAVVIPYGRGLNSGVLALARTFGVAAIVADQPHLRAIADPAATTFFAPDDPEDLADALDSPAERAEPYRSDTPEHFARLVAQLGS